MTKKEDAFLQKDIIPNLEPISILEEIFSKFGSFVKPTERFIFSPPENLELCEVLESKEDTKATSHSNQYTIQFDLTYNRYLSLHKKLYIFQMTNDAIGYKKWLNEPNRELERIFIAIQKASKKLKGSEQNAPEDILRTIAQKEFVTTQQIKDLYTKIQNIDQLQKIITRFNQVLRQQDKDTIRAVSGLWKEIKTILSGEWLLEVMLSQLEVPLIKIPEEHIKGKVKKLMTLLFENAEKIYHKTT